MLEPLLTFIQPLFPIVAILLTFPLILQFLNTKYLKSRFSRFGISLLSTFFVLVYWLANVFIFTQSDVAALMPTPENTQLGPEHSSTISTIHTFTQAIILVIGAVFGIGYLVTVYVVWSLVDALSKLFKANKT